MKPCAKAMLAGLLILAASPAAAGPVEALVARSHAAEAAGKSAEAVVLMQAAVVADPARAASYVGLADLYARQSEPHFALKYYAEALDIDPTLAPALAGAGRAALTLGERAMAEAMLARLEKSCGPDCAETGSLAAALKASANVPPASLDKH